MHVCYTIFWDKYTISFFFWVDLSNTNTDDVTKYAISRIVIAG